MMIHELDEVVLTVPIPDLGLMEGDLGTVVLVHDGGRGYEVEFVTLDGATVAVVTALADQVRAIKRHEIAHAREVAVR